MERKDPISKMPSGSGMEHDIEYGDPNEATIHYFAKCVPLREAATKGDWHTAKRLIDTDRSLCNESITEKGETVLHVAAAAGKTHFVKKLLELPDLKVLEQPDENGNTAFCYAIDAGSKAIAKMMLEMNPHLLNIGAVRDGTLFYRAASFGGEMVIFLYNIMRGMELTLEEKKNMFFACLNFRLYKVAFKLLVENRELARARCQETRDTALHILARDPSAFRSTIREVMFSGITKRIKFPQNIGFKLVKGLWDHLKLANNVKAMIRTPKHLLFEAVDKENFPFIKIIIHGYPHLALEGNGRFPTIFHAAIANRRAGIFYLLHDIGSIKNMVSKRTDEEGNNMLHMVARLPDKSRLSLIPGAALQMQQELSWYEEVKKIMKPELAKRMNHRFKTPEELFVEGHKELMEEGEKWMRNTAKSCMIVATLIATVVFATAFTMPGGNVQDKGYAVFLSDKVSDINFVTQNPFIFSMFAMSASVALAASTTSILFFLAILISPYPQKEFAWSLPLKLVIGISMLLISMIGMMFAFCIAFMLAYAKKSKSIPWVIVTISIVPVILFVFLLGRLFFNLCSSTSIPSLFGRRRKLKSY